MIKVEKLSYSFPEKDLYKDISFTLEDGQHAVLIGSNGTGKTTLVDILLNDEKYMYDGKIIREMEGRVGYVSQYEKEEKDRNVTVFNFLSEDFVRLQQENEAVCKEMETNFDDMEALLEKYQMLLDEYTAIDGDNYESNIKKQLKTAGLSHLEQLELSAISGGEYKLLQVVKQMLLMPSLLIMDEPDVFLDFENLNGLRELINSYRGTILAITHNRFLLNHCFNKILHLEDSDIQEFDGTFVEYNFSLLAKKIEMQEQVAKEQEEIERNQKIVEKLRANATVVTSASRGKALHARVSYLERLEARRIKAPFVNLRQPKIQLPLVAADADLLFANETSEVPETEVKPLMDGTETLPEEKKTVLQVADYMIAYEDTLLENVRFEIKEGDKVAIVGPNGTGKTTLLRDIYQNDSGHISIADGVEVGFLSQIHGEMLKESNTIYEEFEALGFQTHREIAEYLEGYYFDVDMLNSKIEVLSGGEKNLLQLAKIAAGNANLLLLDEPTSHLDTYAQIALEKAIENYKGTVLMVSHDFYTIVNCADYILFVEDKSIRRMRTRSFRKMIYENHFSKDYLELEQQKKEVETRIEKFLQENDYESAKELCEKLESIVEKMKK
ncbi:MAG: ABC-F family ATP-binding cassette domain-containing protein [Agathobacter sp.]|nr:ABC-F family ATP-binding cassette domain-containing protein [Agathobacter sp.]